MNRFSGSYGDPPDITIREDAPEFLRKFVKEEMARFLAPRPRRKLVARVTHQRPPYRNSEAWQSLFEWDAEGMLATAEWYFVYDLIEAIYEEWKKYSDDGHEREAEEVSPWDGFELRVNDFFDEQSIGWKMQGGRILARGTEAFESMAGTALYELKQAGMDTASAQIHEAIRDLSRRPNPDLTGAVQHGMAALECAGKFICGMTKKETLDDVVKMRPDLFSAPLHEAIPKLWGFASNRGRHLQEGNEPSRAEAELVVGIAATVATYLSRVGSSQ